MAMRSNQTDQMNKFMQQTLQLLAPELSTTFTTSTDGSTQILQVSSGSAVIALLKLQRRTFNGFNIVAELDTTVGQGFPEHQMFVGIQGSTALAETAKILKAAFSANASTAYVVSTTNAPTEADLSYANASEIPNDARMGSVGL